MTQRELRSVADVCDVSWFPDRPAGDERRIDLLIELPHGATRGADFESIRSRLRGALPERLEEFFFVNTDVGCVECARCIAELVSGAPEPAPKQVMILRSLIPRTLIDCNRIIESDEGGMTPGLPPYVTCSADREWLSGLHAAYVETAERAHRNVCGAGGLALILHTYAPRSVGIDVVDATIVERLHRAYAPGVYENWPLRPDVDIISQDADSNRLASAELVADLRRRFASAGYQAAENATYRLHPATLGHRLSAMYPGRVLCVELNRGLLADPFTPFQEMTIGPEAVERLSRPLAAALLEQLSRER